MTPGKLISIIAVLILLALAAEGGYYWGFNRGLKNAPAPILAQTPSPTPGPIFSPRDPADIQATVNAMSLLFKPQVIDHLKGVQPQSIWGSYWSVSVGGKLLSLSDKEISVELNPDQKIRNWTFPANTRYQIYNETTRQSSDTPKETIQPGDTINFSVGFDTLTGEIKEARITKSVKN